MKFCPKCGKELKGATSFCGECGASLNGEKKNEQESAKTDGYSEKDIKENKLMGVLSYLGILCLIPYFSAKDSKYAQYHAKQGLNLFILFAIYQVVSVILQSFIKVDKSYGYYYYYTVKVTPWYVSTPLSIISIGFSVLAIIGLVYACQGKQKELPIIGKIKIIK